MSRLAVAAGMPAVEVMKHMRLFDKNGDGYLTVEEMMQALRHSPDVIAKVGNSYKKRLKVASRVETFPNFLACGNGRLAQRALHVLMVMRLQLLQPCP